MRKHTLLLAFLVSAIASFAQKSFDPALDKRVDEYFKFTRTIDIDKVMEYTHPRIFEIVPKEQLVAILEQGYDNEAFSMAIDSIRVINYSKPFREANIDYVKIDYAMKMNMKFKDTSMTNKPEFIQMVIDNAKTSFPGSPTAVYNKAKKRFEFQMTAIAIALKDPDQKDWMFLGYQKNELIDKIFSEGVLKHFELQ